MRPAFFLRPFVLVALLAAVLTVISGCSAPARYDSPDAAAAALVDAARHPFTGQVKKVLGAKSTEMLASGDDVADRESLDNFVTAYDAKHSLQTNDDGSVTLIVGEKDWPLPIPIVKDEKSGKWSFDDEAGIDEILNRRVGRNEYDTIQVCLAVVDAQQEYLRRGIDNKDGIAAYAQKFLSDPGKKNGLYFETAEGEDPSPLGPLVGRAETEGYTVPVVGKKPTPYHGYRYRILTAQGPNAPAGAHNYLVNGRMIGGFALVAWPAEYGKSGVMTFIVNQDGVVYQKDLGDHGDQVAAFDPDASWTKAEPEQPAS